MKKGLETTGEKMKNNNQVQKGWDTFALRSLRGFSTRKRHESGHDSSPFPNLHPLTMMSPCGLQHCIGGGCKVVNG